MIVNQLYHKLKGYIKNSDNPYLRLFFEKGKNIKDEIEDKYRIQAISRGNASFTTIEDVAVWSNDWVKTFPEPYDLIIGIPRGGLLVANIVALKLGKPLTTPEQFVSGKIWHSSNVEMEQGFRNVIVIDEVIYTGRTLNDCLNLLHSYNHNIKITTASLIVNKHSKNLVDLYYKILPQPMLFEWEILDNKKVRNIAIRFEGIICEQCPLGIDASLEQYSAWLEHAKPYLIPGFEIYAIYSTHSERFHACIQDWLVKHNVQYQHLLLHNQLLIKSDADELSLTILLLKQFSPDLVYESNAHVSQMIWETIGIATICTEEMVLYGKNRV